MALKTLKFEEFIEAPVAKVWDTMLGKETYTKWTSVFAEGSTFEGSWEKGSDIKLIDPKSNSGMIARIAENKPHEFISIEHVGMFKNGVPDYESAKEWAPAYENYTFIEKDGGTLVKIDQDTLPEYEKMLLDLWPKALTTLKALCEDS